jgi:hypothetical protein
MILYWEVSMRILCGLFIFINGIILTNKVPKGFEASTDTYLICATILMVGGTILIVGKD